MAIETELTATPATPLVLTILSETADHGYPILTRVRELSGGELAWPDAMLYPLFRRLRRLGYVTTEWRETPDGRRRRYYAITDAGRDALARWQRPSSGRVLSGVRRGPRRLLTALDDRRVPPARNVVGTGRALSFVRTCTAT